MTNKTSAKYFVVAILLSILTIISITCGGGNAAYSQNKKSQVDTLPPVINMIITVPRKELGKNLDSLNYVMGFIGKSLSVDEADKLKSFYSRILANLLSNIKIDTVRIKK